jgi:septal ring factor EnvC (AmiA/AmiB activator)
VGEPKGQLTAPVAGSVVRGYGDVGESGAATGISYQAAPSARVVSPCGGRIVFAGPFRSFGLLLIVDCGGGTHVVLAGFERLDGQVGQSVPVGEPVGVMPGWDAANAVRRPLLYIEVRRDGVAVNPAPFLRARG